MFDGITQWPGKIVSLFEPHSEIIRKGKASKPTEFGKLVQVQEAENQIIRIMRYSRRGRATASYCWALWRRTSANWGACPYW